MCNARNHRPGCNCGWGKGWHAGGYATGNSPLQKLDDRRQRPALTTWQQQRSVQDDFCRPTICPICGCQVFFVRHNGGSIWLDSLGYPWPKHACFSDVSRSGYADALTNRLRTDSRLIFGVIINVVGIDANGMHNVSIRCSDGLVIETSVEAGRKAGSLVGTLVALLRHENQPAVVYFVD